jgi:hypothetical protein
MSQICKFTATASRDIESIIDYVADESSFDAAESGFKPDPSASGISPYRGDDTFRASILLEKPRNVESRLVFPSPNPRRGVPGGRCEG